jgi:hypothetical protein
LTKSRKYTAWDPPGKDSPMDGKRVVVQREKPSGDVLTEHD